MAAPEGMDRERSGIPCLAGAVPDSSPGMGEQLLGQQYYAARPRLSGGERLVAGAFRRPDRCRKRIHSKECEVKYVAAEGPRGDGCCLPGGGAIHSSSRHPAAQPGMGEPWGELGISVDGCDLW